jgi:cytidylate kinase
MKIAVDGPAASGKGTVARGLARALDYHHLDTGLLYRGVAYHVLARGGDPGDETEATEAARAFTPGRVNEQALRSSRVGEAASLVSAHPGVRAVLLERQRRFAEQSPGAVLDGRDIATVVLPDADVKLFVTAAVEERARRRLKELEAQGETPRYADVLAQIQARDARDRDRAASPLVQAKDAFLIDTTNLTIARALDTALQHVRACQRRAGR